jgi:ATP-binding cassette subfamily B protein
LSLYYVGVKVIGTDSVQVGTLIAFGTYISMFWHLVLNLSNFYNQLVTNIAEAERIFEIMDTKADIIDKKDVNTLPKIEGEVEFRNVIFEYDEHNKVLKNVSFLINRVKQ